MAGHRCHKCGEAHLRRSRRRGFRENVLLPLFFIRPYRCERCHARQYGIGFHKLRRGVSNTVLTVILLAGMLASLLFSVYLVVLILSRI